MTRPLGIRSRSLSCPSCRAQASKWLRGEKRIEVTMLKCGASAYDGYRLVESPRSELRCRECGHKWRTYADVSWLPEAKNMQRAYTVSHRRLRSSA